MNETCRYSGCTEPATVVLVGYRWIDDRCETHARQLVLWPPLP